MLPNRDKIECAAETVYTVMAPTPQYRWPLLCERLGVDLWLKHENHSPLGAFKLRGGLVYFDALSRSGSVRHVVTATRGNHGQSVVFCARRCGLAATVVVPLGNSAGKNAAMRALGGTLIEHGSDFQAARERAALVANLSGAHMVPSFHPLLVQGAATYARELFLAVRDLDRIYVPIGLGSGICGVAAARNALSPRTRIVGVVSAHAKAYALSFRSLRPTEADTATRLADGIACRTAQPEALEIIWRQVDNVVEVTDKEVAGAMRLLFECTHNVAEGAGAAAIAAVAQERDRLRGQKVAAVLSGGNVDAEPFSRVLAGQPPLF